MRVEQVISYFGSASEAARALGVSPAAIYQWKTRDGGTIPELRARKIHDVTRGRLRFVPSDYGVAR